jgi:hypothetical protein
MCSVMSNNRFIRAFGVALLLLALAGVVRADGDSLALDSAAPVSGGGALGGGDYTLVGALGQPVAGALEAGEYTLASGVVPAGAGAPSAPNVSVYLPLVQH